MMDTTRLTRIVAVLLLAATALAAAVQLSRRDSGSDRPDIRSAESVDPIAAELARCKALGANATSDAACKTAWAQNRERFLAPSGPSMPSTRPKIHFDRVPSRPLPDVGDIDSNGR